MMLFQGAIGKYIMIAGIVLFALGFIVYLLEKGNFPLFRLPGDIHIKKENFSFHFPIVSGLLISLVLSLLLYLLSRFFR
ncbi:MAG: DUF2905 domain-containing protein [Cyclobacteriaceae bacterium]|nr:DUF2905 domain-containing protein [Cyclobacteriaceae bacterium]